MDHHVGMDDVPEQTPRPRRRRRLILVTGGVLVVAAAVVLGSVMARDAGRPVKVDEAPTPTGSTLPPTPSVLRPAQGLYLSEGDGSDSLDKPPLSQAQGPQMPASVEHRDDGCWTFRIDFSTNHWQTWVYCPAGSDGVEPGVGLVEMGGDSYQRWDLGAVSFDTTSTFSCSEGVIVSSDQEPGDEWNQRCTGTSTGSEGEAISSGPFTFVGSEEVDIGGEPVEALRYRRQRTMTGAQRGTETAEVWFSASSGLPLRNTRTIEASTNTVIGDVTYRETGSFVATSTKPQP